MEGEATQWTAPAAEGHDGGRLRVTRQDCEKSWCAAARAGGQVGWWICSRCVSFLVRRVFHSRVVGRRSAPEWGHGARRVLSGPQGWRLPRRAHPRRPSGLHRDAHRGLRARRREGGAKVAVLRQVSTRTPSCAVAPSSARRRSPPPRRRTLSNSSHAQPQSGGASCLPVDQAPCAATATLGTSMTSWWIGQHSTHRGRCHAGGTGHPGGGDGKRSSFMTRNLLLLHMGLHAPHAAIAVIARRKSSDLAEAEVERMLAATAVRGAAAWFSLGQATRAAPGG